jgi:predicted nucleic acid-binding protein
MIPAYLLDAWAFLALLQKEEPAASRVHKLLQEAEAQRSKLFLSIINLGEIYYSLGKAQGRPQADETVKTIYRLPINILPASDESVLAAAALKMDYAISYADAFAAAEAKKLGVTLVTGDPELFQLQGIIKIEKLKRHRR